ncbi:hypothetical protein ERO13_D04G103100v2 [Gossypium hirsutum]|nr:hypothetical protein ERO13_D04G103100v2 [Gossypium hirsutum]
MDLHLKQCRNLHESDHQQPPPSANIPKLHFHHHHHQHPSPLPLLVPHHHCKSSSNNLPPLPHSSSTFPSRMGSFFSLSQWQELELQALIFRYMLAGAAVPPQLLQSIENSTILHSPSYFLHHPIRHVSHYQPPLLQSGYWGRAAMDPEPGRCRRTDGKKWRCSRDVVAGQKYCERHVHRGRNRSRKPVEMLKSSGACTTIINNSTLVGAADGVVDVGCGGLKPTSLIPNSPLELAGDRANSLLLSGHSPPVDLLRLNYRKFFIRCVVEAVNWQGRPIELGCWVGLKPGGFDGRAPCRGFKIIHVQFTTLKALHLKLALLPLESF